MLNETSRNLSPRLFINYRTEDTGPTASHLAAALTHLFGQERVFIDHRDIEPSEPWPDRIRAEIERATVVLALIGDRWISVQDPETGERRLDQEGDWVREELGESLSRGTVILPVLVDGAKLPSDRALSRLPTIKRLTESQAVTLHNRDRWEEDLRKICAFLERRGFQRQVGVSATGGSAGRTDSRWRHVHATFRGRAREVDAAAIRPCGAREARDFVEGRAPITWEIASSPHVIERDVHEELLQRLSEKSPNARLICVIGPICCGKSCLAWKAAYEACRSTGCRILQILDPTDAEVWYRLPEYAKSVDDSLLVLVDDPFRSEAVVTAIGWLEPHLPITVLATSRPNEVPHSAALRLPLERLTLAGVSDRERDQLLGILGVSKSAMSAEQLRRFERQRDFATLVLETAGGDTLSRLIGSAMQMLQRSNASLARAYEYVCHSYSLGVELPVGLLERMDHRGEFHNIVHRYEASGLLYESSWRSGYVRAGNSRRAELAANALGRGPANVLGEMVEAADAGNLEHSAWVAYLLQCLARNDDQTLGREVINRHRAHLMELARTNPLISLAVWQLEVSGPGTISHHERAIPLLAKTASWLREHPGFETM
ncbi:toll/interleukin-1 receptor domain-containing protein, partial [Candidatus Bipolaricaulota bacterium]|nr:toll/interleukin-1 receptor domain-containing protein [Candidatus Bipolaricaulota bacterium]